MTWPARKTWRKTWNSNNRHLNHRHAKLFDFTQDILDIESSLELEEAALEFADEMRTKKKGGNHG